MEVLAYLCDQGGDPTMICSQERTPKAIAEEDNCKIAAALLGKSKQPEYDSLEIIQQKI